MSGKSEASEKEIEPQKKKAKVEDNIKAIKFNEFLMENNISIFSSESMDDEMNTVLFRSRIEAKGQILPTVIIIDASIFTIIRTQIVGGIEEEKRAHIIDYLNCLNMQYKIFKYYLRPDGFLFLDMCIPFMDDAFDPRTVHLMLGILVQHLQDVYEDFMEHVWAKGEGKRTSS